MIDGRFYTHNGPLSLGDLIDGLDVQTDIEANSLLIHHAAPLDKSTFECVSYYGGRAYKNDLVGAIAAACFTTADDASAVVEAGLAPIISAFPRADFARIITKLYTRNSFVAGASLIASSANIAKTAQILPGVVIGDNAEIHDNAVLGPNAVIGPGVVIGEGSIVESNASVSCAIIGKGCTIHSSACIGGDGFGVAPTADGTLDIPHIGRVLIADNVSIGYGTMVDRGMLGDTIIGKGSKIDNLCQIGHNTAIGRNCMIAGHTGISGSVVIKDGVIMGGRVGIADHLTVGTNAKLAASALLMRDVPDGEMWSGFPAKPVRQHMRETAVLTRLAKQKTKKNS